MAPSSSLHAIFNEAQHSDASHRKLIHTLRNVQMASNTFNKDFISCLNRILPFKKVEADRIIRFCVLFISFAGEKDGSNEEEDTMTSRLVTKVIIHLCKGLDAKDKIVRFRCTQIISLLIPSIGAIDDDLFSSLIKKLKQCARDKESSIRTRAVIGLIRLGGDMSDSTDPEIEGIKSLLIELVQHDQSAEVRRSVLMNMPVSKSTLIYILERAQDVDTILRRQVYAKKIPLLGDFRMLSISTREKLLQWGLRDREPSVQKAASKMLSTHWIENADNNLLELLERLDVVNSKVADDAIYAFFETRSDVLNSMNLNEEFWKNLTPECAFLARAYNTYCSDHNINNDKMPEVTRLGFYLQSYFQDYENSTEDEEPELEFVLEQLLLIAQTADYSDEMGRRKIFGLLRNVIASPDLSQSLTEKSILVLRKLRLSEREFSQVIAEIISDIQDTILDPNSSIATDDSFHSATSNLSSQPKKRVASANAKRRMSSVDEDTEVQISVKCLQIAQVMLENIEGRLKTNPQMITLVNELIIPSVKSHNAPVREKGLHCLGLSCLLDLDLARQNLPLFIHCFIKGHEALQITAIQILSDILMAQGPTALNDEGINEEKILQVIYKGLQLDEAPEAQAATAEGAAKLLFARVLKSDDLLCQLISLYFEPASSGNKPLQQVLSFFIPIFCQTSAENQRQMQKIAITLLKTLVTYYSNLEDDESMVTPSTISNLIIDWTDPRKVISANPELEDKVLGHADIHIDLAIDALILLDKSEERDLRKTIQGMLPKLYIPENVDEEKINELRDLCDKVQQETSENALKKELQKFSQALASTNNDA